MLIKYKLQINIFTLIKYYNQCRKIEVIKYIHLHTHIYIYIYVYLIRSKLNRERISEAKKERYSSAPLRHLFGRAGHDGVAVKGTGRSG